jgi:hypothetical protein
MPAQADMEIKLANETFLNYLSTPGMEKRALDSVNDFTRYRMREEGFFRRILTMKQIGNDDLDRQYDTDKPVKIIDREPDSPAAISVPFATLPMSLYIRGQRYRVSFDRILTPRFTKDVDELRTYYIDIRQVLSDNSIKDMLAEEDRKFIAAVNAAMGGAADTVVEASGLVQWETLYGGITRETLQDAFKILPRTISRLEVATVLLNNLTIREVMKMGREEMGGDYSQDVFKNGWSEQNFMNARWVITIKQELVPDDSMYFFADEKFIGKSFSLEDTTMYIERKAFMLEFFAYETLGASIGNTNSLARADFA